MGKVKRSGSAQAKISDIIKATGLSHGTISMALRNDKSVKKATRLKVQQVARELNYVPNLLAGSLSGGRTRIIGVMLTVATPDLVPVMLKLQELSERDNYTLSTFFSYYDDEREAAAFRHLCQIRAEGVIWIPGRMARETFIENSSILKRANIPLCILGIPFEENRSDNLHVGGNKKDAYDMMLDYLLGLGHSNIGFMSACEAPGEIGKMEQEHLNVITEVFAEKGVRLPKANIYATDNADIGGVVVAEGMTHSPAGNRPTAIITSSLKLAQSLQLGLETLGIKVPEEISIMSYATIVNDNNHKAQISGIDIQLNKHASVAWESLIELNNSSLSTEKPETSAKNKNPGLNTYKVLSIEPLLVEGDTVRRN